MRVCPVLGDKRPMIGSKEVRKQPRRLMHSPVDLGIFARSPAGLAGQHNKIWIESACLLTLEQGKVSTLLIPTQAGALYTAGRHAAWCTNAHHMSWVRANGITPVPAQAG